MSRPRLSADSAAYVASATQEFAGSRSGEWRVGFKVQRLPGYRDFVE